VLRDAEGKPLRMIGVNYDITEKRRSEEELITQRRRLNDIIEGTNVGTWEWNVQTGEAVFNDRWTEIIGYTLDDLAPVSIETWMKFAHPDDLKLSGQRLEKHFAGRTQLLRMRISLAAQGWSLGVGA
jgi:PAS domain-containing protein